MKARPAEDAAPGTPPAEVAIDTELVEALLAEQHPDLAGEPAVLFETGWDNATYRLGETRAVRLPRRAAAVALLEGEQIWLPRLAPLLPLPIPAPERLGRPSALYPWSWSVLPWLPGEAADRAPLAPDQARPLVDFLRALHKPAPADAPASEVRGVPLADRAAVIEPRLDRLAAQTDLIDAGVRRAWAEALAAPPARERVLLHGDLHARNVLTVEGRISAVIDWGDFCAGDPATDLAAVWMLLPTRQSRQQAVEAYAAEAALLARARGWAVLFGAVLLETGLVDNPRHAAMGALTLRRVAEMQ